MEKEIKKAAIYIDVDDDITSIIEKIGSSSASMVALVPPKRIGTLQSAVNLKLLKRAADKVKKKVFIVTTDQSLSVLSAGAGIPVAKSLKSDPEIVPLPEDDDYVDVIDGEDPIDNEKPAEITEDTEITAAVKAINDDDEISDEDPLDAVDKKSKKLPKIPSFAKFRKWIFIGIGGVIAIVLFLIWGFVIAPGATITITAKMDSQKVDQAVFLTPDATTDADQYRISAIVKEKPDESQRDFEATGTKDVGDRAAGKITISSSDFSTCMNSRNITAGAEVVLGGMKYATTQAATLEPGAGNCTANDVPIVAANIGEEYNISNGGGNVPAYVNTVANGSASGGTKRTIKVVQQADIDKVSQQLKESQGSAGLREELAKLLGDDVIEIGDSFKVNVGEVQSAPGVGEEVAEGAKAKATLKITYSLTGVKKDDVSKVLNVAIMAKTTNKNQTQIFDNGFSSVKMLSYSLNEGNKTASIRLVTTAKIGPKIDEDKIREQSVGLKKEEIIEQIKKTNGVDDVMVTMTPFWLSQAPSADRIKVTFTVD